jgi:hypothetical protein
MRSIVAQPTNSGLADTRHISTGAGVPSQAGVIGELFYDSANEDVYINSTGSTTWILIFD